MHTGAWVEAQEMVVSRQEQDDLDYLMEREQRVGRARAAAGRPRRVRGRWLRRATCCMISCAKNPLDGESRRVKAARKRRVADDRRQKRATTNLPTRRARRRDADEEAEHRVRTVALALALASRCCATPSICRSASAASKSSAARADGRAHGVCASSTVNTPAKWSSASFASPWRGADAARVQAAAQQPPLEEVADELDLGALERARRVRGRGRASGRESGRDRRLVGGVAAALVLRRAARGRGRRLGLGRRLVPLAALKPFIARGGRRPPRPKQCQWPWRR